MMKKSTRTLEEKKKLYVNENDHTFVVSLATDDDKCICNVRARRRTPCTGASTLVQHPQLQSFTILIKSICVQVDRARYECDSQMNSHDRSIYFELHSVNVCVCVDDAVNTGFGASTVSPGSSEMSAMSNARQSASGQKNVSNVF